MINVGYNRFFPHIKGFYELIELCHYYYSNISFKDSGLGYVLLHNSKLCQYSVQYSAVGEILIHDWHPFSTCCKTGLVNFSLHLFSNTPNKDMAVPFLKHAQSWALKYVSLLHCAENQRNVWQCERRTTSKADCITFFNIHFHFSDPLRAPYPHASAPPAPPSTPSVLCQAEEGFTAY